MTYQEKLNRKASEYMNRIQDIANNTMSNLGVQIMGVQLLAAIADELHELNKSIKHRSESEE